MLELEDALDDLIGCPRLLHLHGIVVLRHHSLLLGKVALATEYQVRAAAGNLHIQLLSERIHVTANLLEVQRWHVDDVAEVEVRNLNLVHVSVKEFQEIVGDGGLLGIFHANSEFIGIGRREIERKRVIVPHCLD